MAGINRLGKGPAKPGTMRPQDPNKYKTMDIFSEGTEGDKEYLRMVQDIEDTQQNHMGWLFSRGAFDKGDLLYLRDEEEKRRFAEQELRDSELRSFARMRHRADGGVDTEPQQTAAERAASDSIRRSQDKALQSLIRVKAKVKQKGGRAPLAKKPKLEADQAAGPSTVPREVVKVEDEPEASGDDGAGLAGLLGGYGTDSEEDAEEGKPDLPKLLQKPLPVPASLQKVEVKREAVLPPEVATGNIKKRLSPEAEEVDDGGDTSDSESED